MKAERGSITAIAISLGISTNAVSMWLRGRTKSARIERAVREWALEQATKDLRKGREGQE
jgi:predicted transcriptional regulator